MKVLFSDIDNTLVFSLKILIVNVHWFVMVEYCLETVVLMSNGEMKH